MSAREATRLEWRLWYWFCKLRNICPANAHTLLIYRDRVDPRIDSVCRSDADRTGVCWCGKLPARGADTPATKGESTATGDLDNCWDKAYDAQLERGYQARRAAKRGKPAGIADTETPRADG